MLRENTLPWGISDKVHTAIERIRAHAPPEGVHVAFSGGKDSATVLELTRMSGVPYRAHYGQTGIDPGPVVRFIMEKYPDVVVHRPPVSIWKLIHRKGPPTRRVRFCCAGLKEYLGSGELVITGIRWEESRKRKKRGMVEVCYKDTTKRYLHPIIDWREEDVWQFHAEHGLAHCILYDMGRRRIGCVGCPLAGKANRIRDLEDFAGFDKAYVRSFDIMLDVRPKLHKYWADGPSVLDWWINEPGKRDPRQPEFSFLE